MRFRKGKIVLEESDINVQQLLGKTSTFRSVIEKDSAFFAQTNIIDYSLLLGKIENPYGILDRDLEWLENAIMQD